MEAGAELVSRQEHRIRQAQGRGRRMHADAPLMRPIMNTATDEENDMQAAAHAATPRTPSRNVSRSGRGPVLHDDQPRPRDMPDVQAARDLCLAEGLDARGAARARRARDRRASGCERARRCFAPGDRFTALYAIRSGSCKTVSLSEDGHDQVAGYHMAGEIIGTDGIGTDTHGCQAVALEDTEVCALPFDRIEALSRQNVELPAQPAPAAVAGDRPRARR